MKNISQPHQGNIPLQIFLSPVFIFKSTMTMQKKLKSEYSISKDIYTNMLKPMTPKKYFVNLFLKMYPYVRESN